MIKLRRAVKRKRKLVSFNKRVKSLNKNKKGKTKSIRIKINDNQFMVGVTMNMVSYFPI